VLDDLDDNARKWLALLMNTGKSHGFEGENAEIRFAINDSAEMGGCDPAILDTARQCIGDLESAAALVHVYEGGIRASTLKTLQVEPGAAPLLNFTAFEFFVLDILEATANGLTLNKNNGSGTLVDFLQACAPFLPANFIPAAPPLSRLQQLKTHSARRNNGR
jgi:hypothetical protein